MNDDDDDDFALALLSEKKEKKSMVSVPLSLGLIPFSLSPLFKNQSIVSSTVFLRVLIGFMPCSFAK